MSTNRMVAATLSAVSMMFFAMTANATSFFASTTAPSIATSANDFTGEYQGLWHSMCKTASGRAVALIDNTSVNVSVTFEGRQHPFNASIKDFADGHITAKGAKIEYQASLMEGGTLYLFYARTDRSRDCGMMVLNGPHTTVAEDSFSGTLTGEWYSTENNGCAASGGERKGEVSVEFVPSAHGTLAHFNVSKSRYDTYSRVFTNTGDAIKHERYTAKRKFGGKYEFEKEGDEFVVVSWVDGSAVLKFDVPGLDCGYMALKGETGNSLLVGN